MWALGFTAVLFALLGIAIGWGFAEDYYADALNDAVDELVTEGDRLLLDDAMQAITDTPIFDALAMERLRDDLDRWGEETP